MAMPCAGRHIYDHYSDELLVLTVIMMMMICYI